MNNLKQLFAIVKTDSHNQKENWKQEERKQVIQLIEADNRKDAWRQLELGKTWKVNNRDLTAIRRDHNKRRRVEQLKVVGLDMSAIQWNILKEQVKEGYAYLDSFYVKNQDGGYNETKQNKRQLLFTKQGDLNLSIAVIVDKKAVSTIELLLKEGN